MKFHWGHGIIATLVVFFILIGYAVISALSIDYQLVDEDYYGRELQFQQELDKMNNAEQLGEFQVGQTEDSILIKLPETLINSEAAGKALFFSPSNQANDKEYSFSTTHARLAYPKSELNKGKYNLYLEFTANNINYLKKVIVVL